MVSLEVPVSSLVDSFNRKGKQEHDTTCLSESNISVDNSTILLDCENEIKGIVKRVVKVSTPRKKSHKYYQLVF